MGESVSANFRGKQPLAPRFFVDQPFSHISVSTRARMGRRALAVSCAPLQPEESVIEQAFREAETPHRP